MLTAIHHFIHIVRMIPVLLPVIALIVLALIALAHRRS